MRWLTEHPHEVGESYFEHFGFAARFGLTMLIGGLACLVHAVLPFLCTTSGSRRVRALQRKMSSRTAPPGYANFAWDI